MQKAQVQILAGPHIHLVCSHLYILVPMMPNSQTYLSFVSLWTVVTLKLSSQVRNLLLHQQNSNLPHKSASAKFKFATHVRLS